MKTYSQLSDQKRRMVQKHFRLKEKAQKSLKGICVHDDIFIKFNQKWDKYFARIEDAWNNTYRKYLEN